MLKNIFLAGGTIHDETQNLSKQGSGLYYNELRGFDVEAPKPQSKRSRSLDANTHGVPSDRTLGQIGERQFLSRRVTPLRATRRSQQSGARLPFRKSFGHGRGVER